MDYYEILQLKRTATQEDIRNSYRRLALKYHPGKNTDDLEANTYHFAQIAEAYEVLCDPPKKAIFDQYGEQVLKEGVPGNRLACYRFNGNALQIFEDFFGTSNPFVDPIDETGRDLEGTLFGGAYGGAAMKLPDPPVNVEVVVEATLEEFYNGCLKIVSYERQVMNLDGKSTKPSKEQKEIEIKPGYGVKTVLKFPGEGNEAYAHNSSDLIIRFKELKHKLYERKGNDLIYTYKINLMDALCSAPIFLKTLDQRELAESMDEVISPKTVKVITGEGMPIYNDDPIALLQRAFKKGNLFVKFDIEFPKFVPEEKKKLLRDILQQISIYEF